jgi:hypothetical protein
MRVRYSTKHTISIAIVFLLLLSLVPSQVAYASTVETRYMRSDQHTINGLLAYQLGTAQSASALSAATLAKTPAVEATLRPTSDVATGFPVIYPTTPTTHYDKVDEVTADDAATYVKTGDSSSIVTDRYGKPSFTLPAGKKIGLVRVTARCLTDKYGTNKEASFYLGVEIGGTLYTSSAQKTANAWATKTYVFEKNPATGLAWTQAGINGANLCVRGSSYYSTADAAYYYAYGSQVYMEVFTYTDDTVHYSVSVWKRDSVGTETSIASNIAPYSSLISALHDAAGLKSVGGSVSLTSMVSTDSIVVRVYQKVGAGSWTLVQTWTTGQLGAQSLDAATWTVYYYLLITASASAVNSEFLFGHSSYDSKITNFTWTPAVSAAWHDVSTWTASLVTRTWSSGTSFSFNLLTRTWQTTNSWIFDLASLGWHDTANWIFELRTRVWNIITPFGDETIAANYTERDSGYALWKLFQEGGGCSALGETFQVPSDGNYKLTKASFYLRKVGSPSGYAHAALYAMTGTFGTDGMPTGSALAVSVDFDVSTALHDVYTLYNFTFSGDQQYITQAEQYYCIVYQNPSSGFFNSTNFVLCGMHETPTYEGNRNGYVNDWYGDNVFDTSFYVYGSPITSLMSLYLGTSIWTDIATWGANLVTMLWNDVAAWVFYPLTRFWNDIAVWAYDVTAMMWRDLTWLFYLLPPLPEWVNVAVWIFSLRSPEWMLVALWNLQLGGVGIAFLFIAILLLIVIVAGIIAIAYRRPKQ